MKITISEVIKTGAGLGIATLLAASGYSFERATATSLPSNKLVITNPITLTNGQQAWVLAVKDTVGGNTTAIVATSGGNNETQEELSNSQQGCANFNVESPIHAVPTSGFPDTCQFNATISKNGATLGETYISFHDGLGIRNTTGSQNGFALVGDRVIHETGQDMANAFAIQCNDGTAYYVSVPATNNYLSSCVDGIYSAVIMWQDQSNNPNYQMKAILLNAPQSRTYMSAVFRDAVITNSRYLKNLAQVIHFNY